MVYLSAIYRVPGPSHNLPALTGRSGERGGDDFIRHGAPAVPQPPPRSRPAGSTRDGGRLLLAKSRREVLRHAGKKIQRRPPLCSVRCLVLQGVGERLCLLLLYIVHSHESMRKRRAPLAAAGLCLASDADNYNGDDDIVWISLLFYSPPARARSRGAR